MQNLNQNSDLVITVEELSKLLKIGRTAAYQLVRRPDFPVLRFNRKVLVPVAELREWISKNVLWIRKEYS